jgi:putative transposase
MKGWRFTEEQIIRMLCERGSGAKTADVCCKHGVSEATFYKWKAKFGGLEVSEARRLRQLEDENTRLKKLLADAMLDNAVLTDIAAKKNGDARGQEGRCVRCARGARHQRAAGVRDPRDGLDVGALSAPTRRRCAVTGPSACIGRRTPAVRLSPAWPASEARGAGAEPQEAAAAVCRGTAAGAPPWRSQAGTGHAGANRPAGGAEPMLVAGLRL